MTEAKAEAAAPEAKPAEYIKVLDEAYAALEAEFTRAPFTAQNQTALARCAKALAALRTV